ncbi:MAG: hypothetical protein K2M12_09180 [Muribaculaceae bacterium]|nr:hypothetical protein [Muribaculaceae bacterium]
MIAATFMAYSQTKITLAVGNRTMTASLVENAATRELLALLQQGPITVHMSDYGGFEKVGTLPQSFTTSNSQITTEPGDIMLYQGNNMVIFYGSNSWSYTRLGKIDGATAEDVRQFLGTGNIALNISLYSPAGIDHIGLDEKDSEQVFDLNGRSVNVSPIPPGIYIINGKKTLIND